MADATDDPNPTTLARQRALALACGALAAPVVLGALEATTLDGISPWPAFAATTTSTFYACSPGIITAFVLSLPALVANARLGAGLAAISTAGFGAALMAGLRGDEVISSHPVVWAGLVALCLAFAAEFAVRRRWPALSWGLGVLLVGAGAGAWYANYHVAPYVYFEAHWALTNLTMLCLGVGTGELLLGATRIAESRRRWQVYAGLIAITGTLLTSSALTASDEVMWRVAADTEVGRARLLVLGSEDGTTDDAAKLTAAEAVKVFDGARPFELPPRFDLDDWDVLFVASESIRRDDTSIHNQKLGTTRNLVRWRSKGAMDFRRAYSPSSGTLQSVGSWFGLAPVPCLEIDIFKPHWAGRLRSDALTAAERFAAEGRHTFWIGHNFRDLFGTKLFGFEQGFELVQRTDEMNGKASLKADDKTGDAVVAHLRELKPDQRFFGFVMFSAPHFRYVKHYDDMPGKTARQRYRQEIRKADEQFGRILDVLEETDRLNRTIVVLTADHGEEFNEHGGSGHNRSLYEESIRVPLVVWLPGARLTDPDVPVSNAWLLPWLMLHGDDLAPAVAGRLAEGWAPLLSASDGHVTAEIVRKHQTVTAFIGPQQKYHYNIATKTGFAFDLESDPREKTRRTKLAPHETSMFERYSGARQTCRRYVETGKRPPKAE